MTSAADSPITHRRVLHIAVPIVLSNATVPILGAVDTGVVGQLGEAAPIGAVGLGAILLSLAYWLFGFLRMGITGLAAQALGQGDHQEISALLSRALIIGGGAGLLLIVLQAPLFWLAFAFAPASPEVEALTRDYMAIRIWSAPAAIALFGITGWLIAQERTRAVLVVQVVMNGLNVALDFWFVLGLGWGVEGVAWGTFLAEWTGLAVGLWFCRSAFRSAAFLSPEVILQRDKLRRLTNVSSDILLRSLLLQLIFLAFLFIGASMGDVTLAANQVLMQFVTIAAYIMDGFAFSAEALVGQAVGARAVGRLRRAAILSSIWGAGLVVLLSAVYLALGPWFIDLLTTSEEVRAEARQYLFWLILSPVVGIAPFMLDGIFIGATRTRDMRNMMAVSFAIYVAALLVFVPVFGNHGLWVALLISFIARGVTLWLKYPALERGVTEGG